MVTPVTESASFPTAHCRSCEREVLTCLALGPGGKEQRHCVHCNERIDAALAWVDASYLEGLGYYFGAPTSRSGCGCSGGGCGSCSR